MLARWTNDAERWGVTSTGREGVFSGQSGMAAELNDGGYWYAYIPPPGEIIRSYYPGRPGGKIIEIVNNGDGTYLLTVEGVTTVRRYSTRWQRGLFYDSLGDPTPNPATMSIGGSPLPDPYEVPGELLASTAIVSEQPVISPVPSTLTPDFGTVPPVVQTVTPTTGFPPVIDPRYYTTTEPTPAVPPAPLSGAVKLALGALAAFALLKGF